MNKYVQHLNLDTGVTMTIPAAELAPGCVLVYGAQCPGAAYVNMSQLGISRIPVYSSIPPEAEKALRYYSESVADVDPLPYREHQFLLRCNHHPVRELTILCHIARIYKHSAKTKVISRVGRLELLLFLQRCSMAEKETILQIHQPSPALRPMASRVVAMYFGCDPREYFEAKFNVSAMHFPPIKH
jgi:hypothetical protein